MLGNFTFKSSIKSSLNKFVTFNKNTSKNVKNSILRYYSTNPIKSFKRADLQITTTTNPSKLVPNNELVFGKYFGDHMFEVDWNAETGWDTPRITPFQNLSLHPASSVLHYAIECFEGLKAYKDKEGRVRLFRPLDNMRRMNSSARRLVLPEFDEHELLECIKELLKIDSRFVPMERGYSLYIRPTMISTSKSLGVHVSKEAKLFVITSPVGPYYKTGFKPVSLYADDVHVRAWGGGTGSYKLGANYSGTIRPALEASNKGYSQVLWLMNDEISEVGTMNVFFFLINENGEKELVTPPLDGTILPGITRASVLDLTREWNEFKVSERKITMTELITALNQGRVLEAFGAGTAAIISPIENVHYKNVDYKIPLGVKGSTSAGELSERLLNTLMGIQYGEIPSPWSVLVE